MTKIRPKFISLATKNAIIYFLLTLVGLSSLGYLLFRNSAEEIIRSSEQQVKHTAEIVEIKFVSFIDNVRRDIIHLAQSPFLDDFLLDFDTLKKELLSNEYLALINSKPDYSQIRFIGIENEGREIIRAERQGNKTFLVKNDSLQHKGNRNYFIETIRLPRDSVYFSTIDLNKEFGKISLPAMPTLRVACPIYRKNKIFGIVIINVNLQGLFKDLKALAGSNFNLKLIDDSGHFLIHPDSSKVFTFEFNRKSFFEDDFGVEYKEVLQFYENKEPILFKENDLLYAFGKLFYPKKNYRIYVGIGSNRKAIFASFYAWRRKSMTITFGLAILILFISLAYMQRQARELKDITETMTSFPENITPAKLPIYRNDEIGQLAQRFEEMSKVISQNLEDLRNAKEIVEEAIKEKDAFLENMSHEIRNPIHSILGMIHLLEKNQPGRHQKAFIESLKFNSSNLLSLVNDILDYKKLSTGELKIKNDWFDLHNFLVELSNVHQFSAVAKKIKLTVESSPKLMGKLIYFDPVRLTQIVNNLVINALKFTPENGSVWVRTHVLNLEEKTVEFRISILDTGIGIEEDKVQKIVKRYYSQNDLNDDSILQGVGLGLPIVIQILKLFDSKLQIDSKPNHGSHFYFDLKLNFKEKPTKSMEAASKLPYRLLKEQTFLVIDDDEQTLFLYEHLFSNWSKTIVQLNNIQLIKSLPSDKFDIIISDLNFTQTTIIQYIDDLQRVMNENGLLFIVSGTELEPNQTANLPNFEAQFQKPINPKSLLNKITFALAAQEFGIPNVSSFWEDYDHNEDKYHKAINLLIQEWEIMAIEFEKAVTDQDDEKYTAIRHKLISSVRRLKLEAFEAYLIIPGNGQNVDFGSDFAPSLRQRMDFYVWCLKNKI